MNIVKAHQQQIVTKLTVKEQAKLRQLTQKMMPALYDKYLTRYR